MMIRKWILFIVTAFFAGWACAQSDAPISPDVLVQQTVDEVLTLIKTDPQMQAGNVKRINEVLDEKLIGRFDFRRMTILAMGRNWRDATPDQQKALVDEFKTLLVRTYSKALTQFKNDTIVVKPLRAANDAKDVVVRSEFQRKGDKPIPVDYSLVRANDGQWRCYDIIVGGVSLVTNYRDDFNFRVKETGIDGLIKALADKNRALAP
ncbi:MAG: ABC transporter substrate-binding protein [Burkholderiales bacterium]|jgi:phospholipid transport system substrate-binding protein|nr:ABC transporter substrate-binding protein [Burkholderiales bacterium]